MPEKIFAYNLKKIPYKIFFILLMWVSIYLVINLLKFVQQIDIEQGAIIYISSSFSIFFAFIMLSASDNPTYTQKKFACKITDRALIIPPNRAIPWENIHDLYFIERPEVIFFKNQESVHYTYFIDIRAKDPELSSILISIDHVKLHSPKEVFDEVNYYWENWKNKGLLSQESPSFTTLNYKTTKPPLASFGLYPTIVTIVAVLAYYLAELEDIKNILTIITMITFVLALFSVQFIKAYFQTEKIALKIIPQGIQNESLVQTNKVILWRNIKSIQIKRRTLHGGYIVIRQHNERAYIKALTLRGKIRAYLAKIVFGSYFYIRNDLEEANFIGTYHQLMNKWQTQTHQTE